MQEYLKRSQVFLGMESIAAYESAAKLRIPENWWRAGQLDSPTNQRNCKAFGKVGLRPRVMVDVSNRNLSTVVLGNEISLPVIICPAGGLNRFNPDGELAVARAAGIAGTLMAVAMGSSFTLERVALEAKGPLWNQVFVMEDRGITELLIKRAEATGYKGLVITLDFTGHGGRLHWSGVTEAAGYDGDQFLANFVGIPNAPTTRRFHSARSLTFTWSDLGWVRSVTSMPLILKGIQTAEDAIESVRCGVDAIWISNHGGEGLPGALPTISVLPEIMDAVTDQIEVYIDSGVRKGTDILKALALGAKAVCVGRPMVWGLSVAGQSGVVDVLEIFREELAMAMGLCGVDDVRKVNRNIVDLEAR